MSPQSFVVLAGRNSPVPAWRTDIGWAQLTRIVPLRNLRPEESRAYVARRGIPDDRHSNALAFTHGHPLALSLVADVLNRGDRLAPFDPKLEPDVVRILLERLIQEAPSARHRMALEVCVLAWATTEALLADVLEGADAHDLFEWLCRLSFIEHGPHGLFPHDLAREALDADLRYRNPDRYLELQQRVIAHLRSRFARATGFEQQRVRLDILFLNRHDPYMRPFFAWDALDSAYAEPASPEDCDAMLEMVRAHEGDASSQIARYWLGRQPQAFLVFRSVDGDLIGFMANLELRKVTPDDVATDPAVSAAFTFAERNGPMRPGEEMVHLRFWMGRDTYQAVSSALNLTAVNSVTYWMTHPKLAWNFVTVADPDFFEPHFASISIDRRPQADFEVGGRCYGVFAHDWRAEPASVWGTRESPRSAVWKREQIEPSPPLLVLTHAEFTEAVHQALRDYSRPDLLGANPLMRTRVVFEAAEHEPTSAAIQALLREAADTLTANSKDQKLHRAVWHTYLKPALTQERAAELLDLPFSTYRYQLTKGVDRIVDWLWQHELHGLDSRPPAESPVSPP
ncbi:MAG: ATP-binding protein [Chloroflexota bacterium]|nr:ATP-binding protein [Chloroflexota bacterium]